MIENAQEGEVRIFVPEHKYFYMYIHDKRGDLLMTSGMTPLMHLFWFYLLTVCFSSSNYHNIDVEDKIN